MNIYRISLVLLLSGLLISCASNSNKDSFFLEEKPAKKPKVTNTVEVERNWKVNLGKKIDSSELALSPDLRGDSIYAAATNGKVYKIDALTGKQQWQTKLSKKVTITAGVGSGDGLVLVGSDDGIVYAIKQSDGSLSWERQLSSEVLATPVAGDGVVVARTGDGKVYGLSSYDGEVKWTISRQLPRLTLRGNSKPLLYQNVAFIGFSDGSLVALQAQNGRAMWDLPIAFARGTNEIDRLSDIDTTPLIVGDNLYATSYQEVTHSLNIKEQKMEWSTDVSSFHSMAYDALYLYITDKEGVVHQLDRTNGEKIWSQAGLRLRNVSTPMSVGPFVVVSDGDGQLFTLDKRSGDFVGRRGLGAKNIVGEPISSSDSVYFIDTDGELQSLSVNVK